MVVVYGGGGGGGGSGGGGGGGGGSGVGDTGHPVSGSHLLREVLPLLLDGPEWLLQVIPVLNIFNPTCGLHIHTRNVSYRFMTCMFFPQSSCEPVS